MNQSLILTFLLSFFLLSCSSKNENSSDERMNAIPLERSDNIEQKRDSSFFDGSIVDLNDTIVHSLYDSLKNQFDVEFNLIDLQALFKKVKVEQLTKGKKFSHRFLIENFKCDCFDEMILSFDHTNESFTLVLFETIYVQDLDWCPEHNKWFVFKIKEGKIFDFDLIAEAG